MRVIRTRTFDRHARRCGLDEEAIEALNPRAHRAARNRRRHSRQRRSAPSAMTSLRDVIALSLIVGSMISSENRSPLFGIMLKCE